MRHSGITLTMDTCAHPFPGQEAETVSRFQNMMDRGPEALRATGTTDAAPVTSRKARQQQRQQRAQQREHAAAPANAQRCDQRESDGESGEDSESLPQRKIRNASRGRAKRCEGLHDGGPPGTRTQRYKYL
jgi:hypothetical protein